MKGDCEVSEDVNDSTDNSSQENVRVLKSDAQYSIEIIFGNAATCNE